MSKTISITLSAANMGPNADEAEFDAWASYVNEHIDEALDITSEVDQFAFTGRGAENEDRVSGGSEEQRDAVREWLSHAGWDAFCSRATTTCTTCGATHDSGLDETVTECPLCSDLVVVTLEDGDASNADAALAVDMDAGNGRWSALVRRDRLEELLNNTEARRVGAVEVWGGERYGDGAGTVERGADGAISGRGHYDATYLAQHGVGAALGQ